MILCGREKQIRPAVHECVHRALCSRKKFFDDNLPPGFSAPATTIPEGENSTAFALYADPTAATPPAGAAFKLIAKATINGKEIYTGLYAVETLTLPGLKPETVCSYTIADKFYFAGNASTPEEKACGSKLAPLGFSSVGDVRKHLSSFELHGYYAAYSMKVPPQSPRGCQFGDLSGDLEYELFDCDESRVMFTLFPWYYRGLRVFKLEDGTKIMDLKLPRSSLWGRPQFSSVLATSRRVTYVVLLRDGAELEGYRVP